MKTAEEVAAEHWAYIKKMLIVHGQNEVDVETIGFHYKSAFIHGWKHGVEESIHGTGIFNKLDLPRADNPYPPNQSGPPYKGFGLPLDEFGLSLNTP